jgi:hypothetical protein
VPAKYLSHLTSAATRWNNLVKINPAVYAQLKSIMEANSPGSTWNGMSINTFQEFRTVPVPGQGVTIASCGPVSIYDIITPGPTGTKFVAGKFNLNINNYFDATYTQADWIDVLTHELGHALGIGSFWQSGLQSYGAVPPQNNLLSGSAYTATLSAYKQLAGVPMATRSKIPLESTGGEGTASGHWEDSFRAASGSEPSYYGFTNELMTGYKGDNFIISQLTINALTDMGYQERNPGTNEGTPLVASSASLLSLETNTSNLVKLDCGCHNEPLEISGTIHIESLE